MGTATFKASETLNNLVALAAKKNDPLMLVHDQGLYLMVFGIQDPADQSKALCVYAEGCDPQKDEDWWDAARAICGGDDFGEELNAREVWPLIAGGHGLKVSFSETHMTMKAA